MKYEEERGGGDRLGRGEGEWWEGCGESAEFDMTGGIAKISSVSRLIVDLHAWAHECAGWGFPGQA